MTSVEMRAVSCDGDGPATPIETTSIYSSDLAARWVWIDIEVRASDADELVSFAGRLGLDALAVRDAVEDEDLPKHDDFGTSILVVLHGLGDDHLRTNEVDCFLVQRRLVTIRRQRSASVDALWDAVQLRPELTTGDADQVLGRLADVVTRRLLSVLDEFDEHTELLIRRALDADSDTVAEVTAARAHIAAIRRVVHPQREVLDILRRSPSTLLTDGGRRRFADVFDVASRAAQGIDAARTALAEILDAYRGAEARKATEVTKVLTVYAAIMLPLSLVAGFFGMNFSNLPGLRNDDGWIVVTAAMALVAVCSLGVFVALGWIRRPSGREAGATLGRGMAEAARAPVQIVGAAFEISTMPIRNVASVRRHRGQPDDD